MSSQSPFAPEFPLGLRSSDLKPSLIGWGAYMTVLTGYCALYQAVVTGMPADLPGTLFYVLSEWAIWWFITPLALKVLRQNELRQPQWLGSYLRTGAAVMLVSVAFRVTVDLLTEARGVAAIVIIYVPRYLLVVAALILIWHFFLRRNRAPPPARTRDDAPATVVSKRVEHRLSSAPAAEARPYGSSKRKTAAAAKRRYPGTLLVSKGRDTCPVPVERIQCISAAGNYVEILSDNRNYLLRSTMKKVQELLPPSHFIRVHRSHIVNLNEIDRIRSRRSGNGTVVLRCGKTVSISKHYRSRLQNSSSPAP
jgi:hypothetical protein